MALSGQIQIGVLGLTGEDRNKFEDNTVGIRATSNSKAEIYSNDFSDFDFDIAINGITESDIIDNLFKGVAAGNEFENTNDRKNTTVTTWTYSETQCFTYPCKSVPFYLYANEEVLFNGKMCSKITASDNCTLPDPCYIYDQNDTVYYHSDITQQFEFLYDFDAQPSDAWVIKGLPGSDTNGGHMNTILLLIPLKRGISMVCR